jgi:hypothetical protein
MRPWDIPGRVSLFLVPSHDASISEAITAKEIVLNTFFICLIFFVNSIYLVPITL